MRIIDHCPKCSGDFIKKFQLQKKILLIKHYQCEICENEYNTESEALTCEAKGIAPPQYKVGDVVAILMRYPNDMEKPFVKRTITKVIEEGHVAQYELNKIVQVGKEYWIGSFDLATEQSFHRLGEAIKDNFISSEVAGKILTDDLIDANY